ncbi:deaminase domain-containing protein, partial [Rahnella sp. CJA17(1/100)]|uniref:deaminase domain-containing protein n=1 Tax=Rahnella sp. CJA17(1/100) TaxID=2508951 RepID=UPI001F10ECA6
AGGVLPVMTNASGSASGTTRSAVADGSITVRDTGQQTQDVSTLSRDTENANGHIDKIFDKQKIEENQAVAQAISQVGVQTMQNVVMQAQVNARSDALARLSGTAEYNNASPADQQKMLENSPENVAAEQKYGIGSPFWTAGTAISGALAGLTGGDMSQALAGGLAPYLSLAVKAATTDAKGNVNEVENITGHALAGAVVAYLQGGSVSGGAAGAATGELAAQLIAKELYPGVKPENLTNDQKANVSALSTLAAGLAGGVAGNSSVAAGTGAVAGKTAVENNAESDLSKFEKDAEELRKKENEIFGGLPDTENPELTHNVVSPGLGPGIGVGVGAKGNESLAITAALTQQVADLRAALTGSAKTSGNVGVAQIDIPGIQTSMAASSRISVVSAEQQALGFVGEVPETFPSSIVPTASNPPQMLNRVVDSEAKILNNIAAKLGDNTSVSGTINLLTERAPCLSCSNTIELFKAKYPNITVNVFDNGGVIRPTKKGL